MDADEREAAARKYGERIQQISAARGHQRPPLESTPDVVRTYQQAGPPVSDEFDAPPLLSQLRPGHGLGEPDPAQFAITEALASIAESLMEYLPKMATQLFYIRKALEGPSDGPPAA